MRTVAEAFDNKNNNFNLIRMVAALAVLIGHCWPLTGHPPEPALDGYESIGGLSVAVFFVISGFLVTRSVLSHHIDDYLRSRALRILPALIVVVLLSVFVLGPIFTTLDLPVYFSSATTWRYLSNAAIFYFKAPLPGVFEGHTINAVNGSLWTLPIECGFYLILPLFRVSGALTKKGSLIFLVAIAATYFWIVYRNDLSWSNQGAQIWASASLFAALNRFMFFFAGALLWIHRDRVPRSPALAVIMLSLLFVCAKCYAGNAALFVALPYLVIYVASAQSSLLGQYRKIGDYSYGTYIFAFPVQQAVVALHGPLWPWTMLVIAAPITLVFAVLSWQFVERPALELRDRFAAKEGASESPRTNAIAICLARQSSESPAQGVSLSP